MEEPRSQTIGLETSLGSFSRNNPLWILQQQKKKKEWKKTLSMLVDDVCLFHILFLLVFFPVASFFVFVVLKTEVGIKRSAFVLQNQVDGVTECTCFFPGLDEICTIELLFKVVRKWRGIMLMTLRRCVDSKDYGILNEGISHHVISIAVVIYLLNVPKKSRLIWWLIFNFPIFIRNSRISYREFIGRHNWLK